MNTPLLVAKKPALVRDQRCETCKWAFAPDPGGLECRRHPPSAHIIMASQGPQPVSIFPPTQPTHFCGEHTMKITVN